MKKTLFITTTLLISSSAIANPLISLDGKNLISVGDNSKIELRFTSHEDLTLDTQCYNVNGKYAIEEKSKDVYRINFALHSYTDVLKNCTQSYSDKKTTLAALHSLNWNKEVTFKIDHNLNTTATMTGDNGSMITYLSK